MRNQNRYEAFRHVGILLAVDVGACVADLVRFVAALDSADMESAASYWVSPAHAAGLFLTWSISLLRLLVWLFTLMSLSRLAGLYRPFGRAQLWFFLRALLFLQELLLPSFLSYAYSDLGSHPRVILSMLLIVLVSIHFGETVLLPLGCRAILSAGAEFLESFGERRLAEKIRHCGRLLRGFSRTALGLGILAALPIGVLTVTLTAPQAERVNEVLILLSLGLALPYLIAAAGVLALRWFAAYQTGRIYRYMKELSE